MIFLRNGEFGVRTIKFVNIDFFFSIINFIIYYIDYLKDLNLFRTVDILGPVKLINFYSLGDCDEML